MSRVFPLLFRQVHGDALFKLWVKLDQPKVVRIIPLEPLEPPLSVYGAIPSCTVTVVAARCWNDRGTMRYEAYSEADLRVAEEWARKHADTPLERFKWYPFAEREPC